MPFVTPVLVILVHVLVWSDMTFCVTVGCRHQQFSGALRVGWQCRRVLYLARIRNVGHHVTEIRCGDVDGHRAKWHSLKPQISSLIITLLKNDALQFLYIPSGYNLKSELFSWNE
jgi:hypothetical protein